MAFYPENNKTRIDLLLRVLSRLDTVTAVPVAKPPVTIRHLVILLTSLWGRLNFDSALLNLCIVAFWGLVWLAELTYNKKDGRLQYKKSALIAGVKFITADNGLGGIAVITLQGAKTAGPGGSQLLLLSNLETSCQHPTRCAVVARIQQVMLDHGKERLLGHSFQVGGA
ncbi:hypothetical protein PGT21_031463 [Puccinia graminis f. sp. tritici]|uniref:Uncharacterized protein n=1 Tax=Puccinia graminis f. sp. tritici TaxID=56615 RepID=A0A5B0PZ73_PUCGR|nr:hypothetical protein PGT21_031463 [Puccinia graminis f. sp. tritici]KAA1109280.1 hypothetical protein PGTUg99_025704 [Puccinia graminis f. sp. tritici]